MIILFPRILAIGATCKQCSKVDTAVYREVLTGARVCLICLHKNRNHKL